MPNNDLISRKALLDELSEDIDFERNYNAPPTAIAAFKIAIKRAKSLPAVDAEPVKRGRWENGGDGIYDTCTYCKEYIYMALPMNYCPNCGAKMEKEE